MTRPLFTGSVPSRPTYASSLRTAMAIRGVDRTTLAKMTHRSTRTVSQILDGIRFMSDQDAADFATALGFPAEYLYHHYQEPQHDGTIRRA